MGSRVIILNHYYLDHTDIIYCNLTVIENHEGEGGGGHIIGIPPMEMS